LRNIIWTLFIWFLLLIWFDQKIPTNTHQIGGDRNVLICQNIKNTVTAECTVDSYYSKT
jgi:hypothetical protein